MLLLSNLKNIPFFLADFHTAENKNLSCHIPSAVDSARTDYELETVLMGNFLICNGKEGHLTDISKEEFNLIKEYVEQTSIERICGAEDGITGNVHIPVLYCFSVEASNTYIINGPDFGLLYS